MFPTKDSRGFFAAKPANSPTLLPGMSQRMKPVLSREFLGGILSVGTALALASCSSTTYGPIDDKKHNATYEKGVPGGTVVETYELTATVTEIDVPARKVSLVTKDGTKETVKCPPEVINLDQIRVGDLAKLIVTSELTVAMADAATERITSANKIVALAPKGAKPGGVIIETQQYTATVTEIDLKRHQVTLRFPDGSSRTFNVREDVDLTQRKVGEEVTFQVATATAISIEKP
jgi:uncharacterized protein (DUF1501 family)